MAETPLPPEPEEPSSEELRPLGAPAPPEPSAGVDPAANEPEEEVAAGKPQKKALEPQTARKRRKKLIAIGAAAAIIITATAVALVARRSSTAQSEPAQIAQTADETVLPEPAVIAADTEAVADTVVIASSDSPAAEAATDLTVETQPPAPTIAEAAAPVEAATESAAPPEVTPAPVPAAPVAVSTEMRKAKADSSDTPFFVMICKVHESDKPSFVKTVKGRCKTTCEVHDFTRPIPKRVIHDFSRNWGPCLSKI